MKKSISGLWAPLLTPMYFGNFDEESMKKLIQSLDPFVNGYAPCMSSGEGTMLSDEQWEKVVACTVKNTSKPVIAAILGRTDEDIIKLSKKAEALGCLGIAIAAAGSDDEEKLAFCTNIASQSPLPLVIYNLEGSAFTSIDSIKTLDQIEQIMAIKDSSGDKMFFKSLVQARSNGEISMSVLQGVEYNAEYSQGCDGYLTALINVEPELSKKLLDDYSKMTTQDIMDKFWQYNLGGEWYVTLKAILYSRKILRSAEQVRPTITPGASAF
jgi:4-hydroxy-tetrahydrodipicolinate synthase